MTQSRLRGSLLGLAVGDALGAAVEFRPPGSFPLVTGYRAGGPHGLAPGEWTDDTSMALALADSLIHGGWDLNDQAARYLDWYRNGAYSVNDRCFDIGIQTSQALQRFAATRDALNSASADERASGNGSIMRLAPVVIRYHGLFPNDIGSLLDFAEQSSLPTHASPICRSACRYFALVLAALAAGIPRDEVLAPDWSLLSTMGTPHPALAPVIAGSFRSKQPPAIRGGGFVIHSLEAALWAFHQAEGFRQAVLAAVNLGDDADTTGAVCGQLAGVYWGEDGIPPDWLHGLARRELIDNALDGLLSSDAKAPTWTYWVEPGRLLAGCHPRARNPQQVAANLRTLLHAGVRVFVNLTESADYTETLAAIATEMGVEARCLRFPIRDFDIPTLAQMESLMAALDEAAAAGERVYLHCQCGIGRTGTVAACRLLSQGAATGDNVFAHLAELRRQDREHGHLPSPETAAQREFVLRWASERSQSPSSEH